MGRSEVEIRIVTVAKKDSGGECLGVVDGVWSVVSSGSPFKLPKWFSLPLHGGLHGELQPADGPPHTPLPLHSQSLTHGQDHRNQAQL